MKRLFLAVMLLGILCSCASKPEPAPLFECRFHTDKDAPLPNGWLPFIDGFFKAPVSFAVKPYEPQTRHEKKNADPKACTFTVETGESPTMLETTPILKKMKTRIVITATPIASIFMEISF